MKRLIVEVEFRVHYDNFCNAIPKLLIGKKLDNTHIFSNQISEATI